MYKKINRDKKGKNENKKIFTSAAVKTKNNCLIYGR